MREIDCGEIRAKVAEACVRAACFLPADVAKAISEAKERDTSAIARGVLGELEENAAIAREKVVPICQDTGFTIVFVKIGREVHITGGNLNDAIGEGVGEGYTKGYLRKSIVRHPLDRVNTGDNTPPWINTEIVPGDGLEITIAPKGGGSENMSKVAMLKPAQGKKGVVDFVIETVKTAGPNPCPPVIVGVGLGGTMDGAGLLSKKALLREIGSKADNPIDAELEAELFAEINKLRIGPAGYGGDTTALAVFVKSHPCHIASLPVAVTIQCHAARHEVIRWK